MKTDPNFPSCPPPPDGPQSAHSERPSPVTVRSGVAHRLPEALGVALERPSHLMNRSLSVWTVEPDSEEFNAERFEREHLPADVIELSLAERAEVEAAVVGPPGVREASAVPPVATEPPHGRLQLATVAVERDAERLFLAPEVEAFLRGPQPQRKGVVRLVGAAGALVVCGSALAWGLRTRAGGAAALGVAPSSQSSSAPERATTAKRSGVAAQEGVLREHPSSKSELGAVEDDDGVSGEPSTPEQNGQERAKTEGASPEEAGPPGGSLAGTDAADDSGSKLRQQVRAKKKATAAFGPKR